MDLINPITQSLFFMLAFIMPIAMIVVVVMTLVALYYSIKVLSAYIKLNDKEGKWICLI